MKKHPDNPLSFRNIAAGVVVTVIGGIILAYIIQDARFSPKSTEVSSTSTPSSQYRAPSTLSTTIPFATQPIGNTELVTIKEGFTSALFNGELFITVNEATTISCQGVCVTATIGTPGYSNQTIENAQIGFAVIFESKNKYDIRIGSTSDCTPSIWSKLTYCVDFYVTRLEN